MPNWDTVGVLTRNGIRGRWLPVGHVAHFVREPVDGFLGLRRDSCAGRPSVELPSGSVPVGALRLDGGNSVGPLPGSVTGIGRGDAGARAMESLRGRDDVSSLIMSSVMVGHFSRAGNVLSVASDVIPIVISRSRSRAASCS